MLGQSILSQFRNIKFNTITLPFVDSRKKASEAAEMINQSAASTGIRPIVLSTMVDEETAAVVANTNSFFLDCLGMFIAPLEKELGALSSHTAGLSHSASDWVIYHHRIEAVNFSLGHDDGLGVAELNKAEVVLVGVSRSGKTPTCLYLALQFGVSAANYPLTPEDLERRKLPDVLESCRGKLYGLTIEPERLHQIRTERRANTNYSSLENCLYEVRQAELLMRREQIPVLDTTTKSIEELSTIILQQAKLKRKLY